MQEGHRRLKEAFDKTRQMETENRITLSIPEHDLPSTSFEDLSLEQQVS